MDDKIKEIKRELKGVTVGYRNMEVEVRECTFDDGVEILTTEKLKKHDGISKKMIGSTK